MTAYLLQFFTGIFATTASCQPKPMPPRYDKVVLVHGIFEDGRSFFSLRKRLERHGIECYVPALKPMDARSGIDELARQLQVGIDQKFGTKSRIAIVGFSMGGLISRYYLQNLGGAERCESLVTISSPHHGTKIAHFYWGKGARQMRPHSEFLKQLHETEHRLGKISVVSYRTPFDLMIRPTDSSLWPRAENRSHPALLHPLMLYSKPVLDDIEKRFILPESNGTK